VQKIRKSAHFYGKTNCSEIQEFIFVTGVESSAGYQKEVTDLVFFLKIKYNWGN